MAAETDFIAGLIAEMRDRKATQAEVAEAAGLSQAHVSRLLSRKFPLTKKSKNKLTIWIDGKTEHTVEDRLHKLVDDILASPANRKRALVPLLAAFEAIVRS